MYMLDPSVHLFIRLVAVLCIPGFGLSQLSCSGSSAGIERSPRTRSVMHGFISHPRAGFSLKKEKAVLGVYLCLAFLLCT